MDKKTAAGKTPSKKAIAKKSETKDKKPKQKPTVKKTETKPKELENIKFEAKKSEATINKPELKAVENIIPEAKKSETPIKKTETKKQENVKSEPSKKRAKKDGNSNTGLHTSIVVVNVFLIITILFLFHDATPLFKWLCVGAALLFQVFASVMYIKKVTAIFRLSFIIITVVTVFAVLFGILHRLDIVQSFNDMNKIKDFILSLGFWGEVGYVLLGIIEILFIPLPSIVLNVVGIALYGPLKAFILGTIALLLGSMIAFSLGKIFGKKLSNWIVGKENAEKYRKLINKKGKYILVLMFLFPMFPDDLLCIVAGLTSMSYRFFFFTVLFTRPIALAVVCFFGSGQIIPFKGWGLAVWGVLIAALIGAFILLHKNEDKILKFFKKHFSKKKKRKKEAAG